MTLGQSVHFPGPHTSKAKSSLFMYLSKKFYALAGVAQWIEHWRANLKVASLIPDRVHARVAGQVPSWGRARRNRLVCLSQTSMFLSLSFSLLSPLSKNN